MKKINSDNIELLKLKLEYEKKKISFIRNEDLKHKKEIQIQKLELRLIELKMIILNKSIKKESDADIKKSFEKKIGDLTIKFHKIKYPFTFMNPAILKTEEDRLIGCIKLKKEEISYNEYITKIKNRISLLFRNQINQLLEDRTDEVDLTEEEIDYELKEIIKSQVENLYDTLSFPEKKYIESEEEILEEIFYTDEFNKWSFSVRMRFDEILLNNQLLINIYGDDPTLDYLYDSEAYQIIEEITFNDIIEALCFNEGWV